MAAQSLLVGNTPCGKDVSLWLQAALYNTMRSFFLFLTFTDEEKKILSLYFKRKIIEKGFKKLSSEAVFC